MARYKKGTSLIISFDPVLNKNYSPSGKAIHLGIYKCPGCDVLPGELGEDKPAHDRVGAEK